MNSTSIYSNATTPKPFTCILDISSVILLFLYVTVGVIGVLGNACICYIFAVKRRKMQSVTQLLIIYLALIDLLASIFGPFVFSYWIATCHAQWAFGQFACKVMPTLSRVSINMSIWILLVIAVDRFLAICRPFWFQLRKCDIKYLMIAALFISALMEWDYVIALTSSCVTCRTCTLRVRPGDHVRFIKTTTAFLLTRDFISLVGFTFVTFCVVRTLRRRDLRFSNNLIKSNVQERANVVRLVVVMQVVFLVCILPRDLLHAVYSLSWLGDGPGIPQTESLNQLNHFLRLLQNSNCCANIFVYSRLHDIFRREVKQIVPWKLCKRGGFSPQSSEAYKTSSF